MDSSTRERKFARARRNIKFVRALVALHPKPFTIAVAGAAVFALCTVASSVAIQWTIDHVILPRFEVGQVPVRTVAIGCALIVGIGLIRAVGVVVRRSFAGITQWRIAETLTGRVAQRYVDQPNSWHQRHTDGKLLATAGVDVETAIGVMAPIPFATGVVVLIGVSSVWMVVTDSVLGIAAIAVFPFLIVANVMYQERVERHFDDAQVALGVFSGAVHESFEAVQLVKAYGAELRETERLTKLAGDIRTARVKAVHLRGTFEALLDVIPSLTNIGLVVLGAMRVDSGDVTVGEFSAFIFMFTLLVFPLRIIGYALSELPHSQAGWTRVKVMLDEPLDVDPLTLTGETSAGEAVRLDNVTFTFVGAEHPAVNGAAISIPAGTVTACVGSIGSGKSTLVGLIAGLLTPTSGTVSVASGTTALVFQEAFLFGGTVHDNVAVGADVSDDDVWEALRLADAEQFVRDLPDNIATIVGERGVTLSGGQRQRIALARALIRKPTLLVLDDTTSALDPATESIVLSNLRSAMPGTTVVMVASRPSTIAIADDVLFVVNGSIVAHGTHDELMAGVDDYRALVEAFEADRAPGAHDASEVTA